MRSINLVDDKCLCILSFRNLLMLYILVVMIERVTSCLYARPCFKLQVISTLTNRSQLLSTTIGCNLFKVYSLQDMTV